jgi:hypothetical protein
VFVEQPGPPEAAAVVPVVLELALDCTHTPLELQVPPGHRAPTFTTYVQLPFIIWQVPGTM